MADQEPLNDDKVGDSNLTVSWWDQFLVEVTSPINIALILAIVFLLYKILKTETESSNPAPIQPPLPRMKKRDLTLSELKKFDGTNNPEGRVLVAVLGKVYDVTKGKKYYGPGGPYSGFGGRDASRGLATFNVEAIKDEYDDLSDLKASEMEQVREWELQFSEKYEFVGKLIRPGEEPTFYSDASSDEEDNDDNKTEDAKKKE